MSVQGGGVDAVLSMVLKYVSYDVTLRCEFVYGLIRAAGKCADIFNYNIRNYWAKKGL